jgi:ribosomal protein L34
MLLRSNPPNRSHQGAESRAMKVKIRNSKSKKAKKTGFLTRQRTAAGRKINKRQRRRHGAI